MFNPVERNPKLMDAITEIAREVRRLGIPGDFVHSAFQYAYLYLTRDVEDETDGQG